MFGFGGGVSKSSSESSSSSFDNLDQVGISVGEQGSVTGGQSTSRQTLAFEDLFSQLFGGSAAAAAGINTGSITSAANNLFSNGTEFLQTLGLDAGTDYLTGEIQNYDKLADAQVDQLSEDVARFLGEDVAAIDSRGVAAGTLGGSRGELQRGVAEGERAREFIRGSTAIRQGAQGRTDSLAQFLSGQSTTNAGLGLSALPGLLGLQETGAMSGLSPFLALSQIYGGPTVLTDAQSTDFGSSFGRNFGFDQTTGRAASESSSSSSSSSKNFSIGF
jgi:hypothetical protein